MDKLPPSRPVKAHKKWTPTCGERPLKLDKIDGISALADAIFKVGGQFALQSPIPGSLGVGLFEECALSIFNICPMSHLLSGFLVNNTQTAKGTVKREKMQIYSQFSEREYLRQLVGKFTKNPTLQEENGKDFSVYKTLMHITLSSSSHYNWDNRCNSRIPCRS